MSWCEHCEDSGKILSTCYYCKEAEIAEDGTIGEQDCSQTVQCAANDVAGAGA